mmetsp:Transcript_5425/g.6318  ORF Transcript_5425/g.6318 Transcript_5425/m.6318 type:complete len:343 (-) Transcript_5425:270-1298(-)
MYSKNGDSSDKDLFPVRTRCSRLGNGVVTFASSRDSVATSTGSRDNYDPLFNHRFRQLIAGGGAGAFTKTATAPLERVKILQQLQGMKAGGSHAPKYRGILGTIRTVVQEEGFLALYKGNGANVLRVIPVYALKFTFNDTFRDLVKVEGQPLTFSRLILSGTMAGLFQTCVTYPLETVRTRLTLGKGLGVEYKGILDVFRQTIRTEGVGGLYKGIGPTFLTGSPYVGLQMTFYEIFKRNQPDLEDNQVVMKQVYRLVCGAVAGLIAQTITYPGDTIRRRMQTNGMKGEAKIYSNSIDCTRKLIQQEGFKALFNGYTANAVRCLPGAAIQFWAYDLLKNTLQC